MAQIRQVIAAVATLLFSAYYKGFPSKVKREIRDGFSLSYS
jgi:hypothetical protein